MPLSDEEMLVESARQCSDCLCWLKQCEAECCRSFTFHLSPRSDVDYYDDVVRVHVLVSPDARKYYELHGAHVDGDFVTVPRSACEVSPTRLAVNMRCGELTDELMCGLHDAGQPDCCRDFTLETASRGEWVVTPKCLFAYKMKGQPHG